MVSCPEVLHNRAVLHFVKDLSGFCKMTFRAALAGRGQQRIVKNLRIQRIPVELLQNGNVVKSLMRVLVVVRVMMVSSFSASTVSRL